MSISRNCQNWVSSPFNIALQFYFIFWKNINKFLLFFVDFFDGFIKYILSISSPKFFIYLDILQVKTETKKYIFTTSFYLYINQHIQVKLVFFTVAAVVGLEIIYSQDKWVVDVSSIRICLVVAPTISAGKNLHILSRFWLNFRCNSSGPELQVYFHVSSYRYSWHP